MKKLKIALIGFGGIARAHYSGYLTLLEKNAPFTLVAACDVNPAQFDRFLKINTATEPVKLDPSVRTYTNVDDLLANEDFDMADICLPSYLHCEYTVKCLRAGKHVLCEKPMALSSAQCEEMIATAKECGKQLMIAQCLRFHPDYLYLKKAVEEGTYGKLLHLEMNRLSAYPIWGYENWFSFTEKSGGCILDMHIHDIDMARFLLGEPQAVSTVASDGISRWQRENTRLYYPDGLTVIANGSWSETRGTPFVESYRAVFEHATIIHDPGEKLKLYREGEEVSNPETPEIDAYAAEIEYFIHIVLEEKENTVNPPESAANTVRLIEALRKSADEGGSVLSYQ